MQQDLVIKLSFEGKIKRVTIFPDYKSFINLILELFEDLKSTKFFLNYIDEEHDSISIENQKDLISAINYASYSNSILKIHIESINQMRELQSIKESSIQTSFIEESIFTYDYVSLKCESCKREFNHQRSFEIHSTVCSRVFCTKRTLFNSHLMRMRGIALKNNITLLHLTTLFIIKNQCSIKFESQRRECFICNRNFAMNAFDMHAKICKIIHTKRTPFNSKKQRMIIGNCIIPKINDCSNKNRTKKEGMAKWKKDSLRFRNVMKIQRLLLRN